jgi:hypothetical protein
MGFLDKFRKKKEEDQLPQKNDSPSASGTQQQPQRRVKKYTSDGKPVYE